MKRDTIRDVTLHCNKGSEATPSQAPAGEPYHWDKEEVRAPSVILACVPSGAECLQPSRLNFDSTQNNWDSSGSPPRSCLR